MNKEAPKIAPKPFRVLHPKWNSKVHDINDPVQCEKIVRDLLFIGPDISPEGLPKIIKSLQDDCRKITTCTQKIKELTKKSYKTPIDKRRI